jgi:hypothetical protein
MGRQNYSVIGYGMNVQEARRNALDSDRDEYGHQEGYNGSICSSVSEKAPKCLKKPVVAKKCKVEKETQKGTKKWETIYVVQPFFGNGPSRTEKTQGDALKTAKKLAIEHSCTYEITIEKRLVGASNKIARVIPQKSEMGQWLFEGEARC